MNLRCRLPRPAIGIAVLVATVSPTFVAAAPQAELWPRWEAHDPTNTERIDHGRWQAFLDQHLVTDHPSGVNRVDYAAVSASDRALLQRYIAAMESVPISSQSRDTQFAYWINLYNALTVELVLEHYPIDSIRDIRDPWDQVVAEIEGVGVTLNDIEHRIIRPIWMDERIHYVVNCASYGCPNLQREALTADNFESILDAAASEYVNHPRGARFDGRRLTLSSVFQWYQEDFGDDASDVLRHLVRYAEPGLAEQLRAYDGRIRYEYDWTLNNP